MIKRLPRKRKKQLKKIAAIRQNKELAKNLAQLSYALKPMSVPLAVFVTAQAIKNILIRTT